MQDWMSKLERAKALLDAGVLSPVEFEAEKARLLPHANSTCIKEEEQHPERGVPGSIPRSTGVIMAMVIGLAVATIAICYLLFGDQPTSTSAAVSQTIFPQPLATPKPAKELPAVTAAPVVEMQPAAPPIRRVDSADLVQPAKEDPNLKRVSGWTPAEQRMITRWADLNERCRGGSGDAPETLEACDEREAASKRLNDANICYGEQGQSGFQMEMHRCHPGSLARE